jgi:hypothetical protein
MHPQTAKKILADEDTLDVAKTAEAVREDARLRVKKDKPTSQANSIKAHQAWLAREYEKESFRQRLAKIWNKRKKV